MGLPSAVCALSTRELLDHINKNDGPTVSSSHVKDEGISVSILC